LPAGETFSSLPDLIRQSIPLRKNFLRRRWTRGSASTRVQSPSKTGVNALNDALLPAGDELAGQGREPRTKDVDARDHKLVHARLPTRYARA
jgi:hypothetical protein